MSPHQLILENSFWKFLVSVEELKERKEKVLICSLLGIDEEKLNAYCDFLLQFKVELPFDEQFIYPLKNQYGLKIELSLAEWLALEANLHGSAALQESAAYFNQILTNKFKMVQQMAKRSSLFEMGPAIGMSKEFEYNKFVNFKKRIDYHIVHRKIMKATFINDNHCEIFPHRQVFLDGSLCVVGENLADKSLCYFSVEDIWEIEELVRPYEPNLSQIEINEFIGHLRLVNGKEERLVLKIYSQEEADLLPQHHFLENPFVTSNAEGDMIWAATIELCDDIFHWLYQMRNRVEVLDPGHVRKEFAHYCELKKYGPSKKAS